MIVKQETKQAEMKRNETQQKRNKIKQKRNETQQKRNEIDTKSPLQEATGQQSHPMVFNTVETHTMKQSLSSP